MAKIEDLLQQLHDIHEPPPIPFWPPAIGWWILSGLLLVLIPVVFWIARALRRKQHRRQWKSMINAELDRVEALLHSPEPSSQAVMEISVLLRRLYITQSGTRINSGATGEAWLRQLGEYLKLSPTEQDRFRLLLMEPYRPNPNATEISNLVPLLRERLEPRL